MMLSPMRWLTSSILVPQLGTGVVTSTTQSNMDSQGQGAPPAAVKHKGSSGRRKGCHAETCSLIAFKRPKLIYCTEHVKSVEPSRLWSLKIILVLHYLGTVYACNQECYIYDSYKSFNKLLQLRENNSHLM